MNYKRHYDLLIKRSKNRILNGYTEAHHIIPRCLGGDDSEENLVALTPEEHYLAHQLLVKIHPHNDSLVYAAQMMVPNRPNNKLYGWLKRKHSKVVSNRQKGVTNSQYGTVWITNGRDNKKVSKSSDIPEKWFVGRSYVPNLNKSVVLCKPCAEKIQLINSIINAYHWYDLFRNGQYKSITDFVRKSEYPYGAKSMSKMFIKYIEGYR